jgi:outer membrane protein insertion porin family
VLYSLALFLAWHGAALYAQDSADMVQRPPSYIIGEVRVTGLESYNEQTVKTFAGFKEGQFLTIPSEEVSASIKKLWNLELFSDVALYYTDIINDSIFLELSVVERPTLNNVTFYGVKTNKIEGLIDDTDLKKGKKITESLLENTKNYLEKTYREKGYLNTKVAIATKIDTTITNSRDMVINVNKGSKVKVAEITFAGAAALKLQTLEKALKNTKRKKAYRFWKKSKFITSDFEEDLESLVDAYAERGYRDARVLEDSVYAINEESIGIKI